MTSQKIHLDATLVRRSKGSSLLSLSPNQNLGVHWLSGNINIVVGVDEFTTKKVILPHHHRRQPVLKHRRARSKPFHVGGGREEVKKGCLHPRGWGWGRRSKGGLPRSPSSSSLVSRSRFTRKAAAWSTTDLPDPYKAVVMAVLDSAQILLWEKGATPPKSTDTCPSCPP